MKLSRKQKMYLKNALSAVYREKEKAEVSDFWKVETMRHIRRLGPPDLQAAYLVEFEKFLWRFVPVACALIIVFSVCLSNLNFAQEYGMARLLLDDPIEYAFVELFETDSWREKYE